MDRGYRQEILKALPPAVLRRCRLADLDRQYSLQEIAIITRAGPARILGLTHKGHLGPGADADITIYAPRESPQATFSLPRWVIKSGEVLVEDGQLREPIAGQTLHVSPPQDPAAESEIAAWFNRHYSIRCRNFAATDDADDN
jgi:formylmethanofuran dehydrogenase subunit A